MKRLTYISKFSHFLSHQEIEAIGKVSQRNNLREKITGVLLCSNGIFFQILEGEEHNIDQVYAKILTDERHTEIMCLKTEENIQERLFPDWAMQTIILDENTDILIQPIKSLLQTLSESHRTLAHYTQPTILQIIKNGINPVTIPPRSVDKIILFSDIMAFSTMTEKLPVEIVVAVVNQFLTSCSNLISSRGGEVTKFIGDCVMAYFDGDQGDNAIQASLDILTEMENLRNMAPEGSPLKVLYSGIGLARGNVIEGNIGSAIKMDYTILGDAVNVASRLEALTRKLSRFLVFSADVKASAKNSWSFIPLGQVNPKGKDMTLDIYSIDHAVTQKPDGVKLVNYINQYLNDLNHQSCLVSA